MRVMRINSSIEVVYIWTIAGSLGYPWLSLVIPGYLMVILTGRDCRRFLQIMGKIIANAQTKSLILESKVRKEPAGTDGKLTWRK